MNSDRTHAVSLAQERLKLLPVYLDTETTGIDKNSEIIEICLIDHEDNVLFQSLVKPSIPVPNDVTRIHGITNEMLQGAPSWMRVLPRVQEHLLGRYVGVYNADFDIRMIQQTNFRYGLTWNFDNFSRFFCIMKLFAQYYGEWDRNRGSYRWQSLDFAGKYCRVPIANSHRALDDTRLARAVLHHIAENPSK